MGIRQRAIALLAAAVSATAWSGLAAGATAGVFQFVAGDVRIVDASREREARKGALLNVGDTIATARNATAQIKMGDGAIVVVQPQSRLTVAVYRYDGKEDGSERVVFRLEQGGFRSVTGAIGNTHKSNYLIETPIAHMGVRGTDHESYYIPPGADTGRPGAYNKVNTGVTFIRTGAGEVVIAPNQVGYVASGGDVPGLLPAVPEFFNRAVAPRASHKSPEGGPAAPQVVQTTMTTTGVDLSNPQMMPGTATVAGFVEPVGGTFFGRSALNPAIAPNGAVLANAGGDAAWSVEWGTWQGGAATVNGASGGPAVHFASSTATTTPGQLGVLAANAVNATYTYLGGPNPTNQAGVQGAINPVATSIGVNFAAQLVSYSVGATVDGRTWSAAGAGSIGQFTGASGITLAGTCAGCTAAPATAANGSANGAFVGPAAERLISSFGLRSAQHSISGAVFLGR